MKNSALRTTIMAIRFFLPHDAVQIKLRGAIFVALYIVDVL